MPVRITITFANRDDFARMLGFADAEEASEVFEKFDPKRMVTELHVPWTVVPTVKVTYTGDDKPIEPVSTMGMELGKAVATAQDGGWMDELVNDGMDWFAENWLDGIDTEDYLAIAS